MEGINPWLIYLWGQVGGLRLLMVFLGSISLASGVLVMYVAWVTESDPSSGRKWSSEEVEAEIRTIWSRGKKLTGLGLVMLSLRVLIPSRDTIALMYVLPRVAQSEAIQRDLPDVYRLAVDALKSELGARTESDR